MPVCVLQFPLFTEGKKSVMEDQTRKENEVEGQSGFDENRQENSWDSFSFIKGDTHDPPRLVARLLSKMSIKNVLVGGHALDGAFDTSDNEAS